jgi:hypothetical protein
VLLTPPAEHLAVYADAELARVIPLDLQQRIGVQKYNGTVNQISTKSMTFYCFAAAEWTCEQEEKEPTDKIHNI